MTLSDSCTIWSLIHVCLRTLLCCNSVQCCAVHITAARSLQVKDQARRITQLEDVLREAQAQPTARRRCLDGEEGADPALERQLGAISQELEVGCLPP